MCRWIRRFGERLFSPGAARADRCGRVIAPIGHGSSWLGANARYLAVRQTQPIARLAGATPTGDARSRVARQTSRGSAAHGVVGAWTSPQGTDGRSRRWARACGAANPGRPLPSSGVAHSRRYRLTIMAKKAIEVRECDRCGAAPANTWFITGPDGVPREIELCDQHGAPVANAYALGRPAGRPPVKPSGRARSGRSSRAAEPPETGSRGAQAARPALPAPPSVPEPVWR